MAVRSSQNVSGLAVLDDHATLMGTISIRDLKVRLRLARTAWRLHTANFVIPESLRLVLVVPDGA